MEGKTLGGRYEILHRLGGGGMAVVYLAQDRFLDRRVAVKVLKKALSRDEDLVRRFNREAKAVASMSHPGVIKVYDVGREDDIHYMVMEYMEGASLMDRIAKGKLATREAVEIAIQICDGLEHAHQQGVIHRDIKPHNIMATADGQFKLGDFGISRLSGATAITQTGAVIGSIHYFSPEQARGRDITKQSDIYSLGVVLFYVVTGVLPYDGDEAVAIALKHLEEPVPNPRDWDPELPEGVCHVIARAMAKSKEERYPSAAEMKADLEQAFTVPFRGTILSLSAEAKVTGSDRTDRALEEVGDKKNDRWKEILGKRRVWFGLGTGMACVMLLCFFLIQSHDSNTLDESTPSETASVFPPPETADDEEKAVIDEPEEEVEQEEEVVAEAEEEKERREVEPTPTPDQEQPPPVDPGWKATFDDQTGTLQVSGQEQEGTFAISVYHRGEMYDNYTSEEKRWSQLRYRFPEWDNYEPGKYEIDVYFMRKGVDTGDYIDLFTVEKEGVNNGDE
ncbi:protein kinase domain-containing protein [Desmospora activa]|uniref:Serine/threonine-protein kinase PrkC n=1 Tax=Desmospora activa DSM 45169 TaxID=1121389 RepID=A0A2T4Z6R4_9BACL|nr:protein kinase [Desmospora activa]PTM57582.1 serine/threonine protein kinase [Desmospora activa DSM 45169]